MDDYPLKGGDRPFAAVRAAAMAELNAVLREIDDPAEVAYSAARILGETLGVSRVGYGTVDPVGETITIDRDWNAPGIESLAGVLHFRDYGSYIEDLRRGETVVFSDAETDARTKDNAEALKAISAQAVVNMPVTEQGGLVALLYLNHAEPRDWSEGELDFIREVGFRTRAVAERRRLESALRQGEARWRSVYENAAVGMLEIDSKWRILGANSAYAAIVGMPEAELRDRSCLAFTHRDDVELSARSLRRAAQSQPGDRISFDKRYVRPDGSIVWIRSNLAKISAPGEPIRFLKIVEDITDARRAQEALREESHNLEILNRTGAAVAAELDLEKVVQLVTDAGVELTGAQFGAFFYNVTDAAGESYMLYTLSGVPRSAFERFPMPRNTAVFAPTFEGEGVVRSDDITKDSRYGKSAPYHGMPEGHLPVVSYLAVPVTGRDGAVIGGLFFGHAEASRFSERHERLMVGIAAQAAVAIDNAQLFRKAQSEIEQRVKAEQSLTTLNENLEARVAEEIAQRSRAEDALRQAQKMETIGQLSGGIAHDFNNLLQIIQGNLSMLKMLGPDQEGKRTRAISSALIGTERAAALTQRLLAFSRQQPLKPKPVDIADLVSGMLDMLQRTLGETIRVRLDIESHQPTATVDPNQLENAILNLAVNARDAMPDGGTVHIKLSAVELEDAAFATHPEPVSGEFIRICVSDAGVGMDADTASRAMEPFFTTKEVGRGTGLGLSMVYGFIRQSGGYVDISSALAQGTTVNLYLPVVADAPMSEEVATATEIPRGNGETVILCEDDEDVRQFSSESLRTLGYNVIEAADGPEALLRLRDHAQASLLFTDVVLPGGMTGADLAREARKICPGLRVIFTTGYARSALDNREGGAEGEILFKPFKLDDLARQIARELSATP